MRQVAIPREVYTGSCNELFDFLAEALVHFIKEQSKVRWVNVGAVALRLAPKWKLHQPTCAW